MGGGLNFIWSLESIGSFVALSQTLRNENLTILTAFCLCWPQLMSTKTQNRMNLVFIWNCLVKENQQFKTNIPGVAEGQKKWVRMNLMTWSDNVLFHRSALSLFIRRNWFLFGQPVFSSPFIRRRIVILKYSKFTISRLNFIKHSWNCCQSNTQ